MDATPREDAYVGTTEAAQALGITRQAVLKRVRAGTLPAVRFGRNYAIPVSAIRPSATAPAIADPVLADLVERLVRGYDPERVYLFGSAARGDAAPGSDYDIMLVVPDDAEPERLRAKKAYRELLKGAGAPVDVLIMTHSAFDAKAQVVGSLPSTILSEGVLLRAS